MSDAARTARTVLGITLLVIAWIWGILVWLGALALWARMFGIIGLLIGLTTISDLALPFVWHHQEGH